MQGTELVPVDFHGDSILAARNDQGTVVVAVKRICESLGLGYESQLQKLKGSVWACISNIVMHDTIGRQQETCVIPIDRLPMWLATIRVNKIRPDLRQKLTAYQIEAVGVLFNHFMGSSAPPVVPLPPQPKPWAERIRATFLPHRKWLQDNLPGYWTIASVTEMEMLVIEDELIRHGFNPQPGDRPDVSIGLLWVVERRSHGLPPPVKKALLYLPDQKGNVWVHAYPNEELPAFNAWLHDPYLRRKLLAYLAEKPAFRPAGALTTASVVDHTCKILANGPAELAPPVRKQLAAADGFVPVGKLVSAIAGPQHGLFDARRNR